MPEASLILASRSPRRARLLHAAGYSFEQMTPPFDDSGAEDDSETNAAAARGPVALAGHLAVRKARSFGDLRPAGAVVLCADTLCIDPAGKPLGKPADRSEAGAMIRGFVNTDHTVVTAVALLDTRGHLTCFSDTATAGFGDLSDECIESYLETDAWADKAGGYNLFDRQAAGWPITVTGDPTTVVGLPMDHLNTVLSAAGIARSDVNADHFEVA